MKKQYILLFVGLLSVSLILTAVIYSLSNKYRENRTIKREEEKKLAERIKKEVDIQNKRNEEINERFSDIKKDTEQFISSYEDMYKQHKTFFESLKSLEMSIADSYEKTTFLSDKCKVTYSNQSANLLCRHYYSKLEEITNTYVYVYNSISKKINEYNKWLETYKGVEKFTKIKLFDTKYNKYVDLNNDKTQLGAIEE